MLLVDFEKAYDSISFKYVEKCLKFFNLGEKVVNWVNTLLNNFYSVKNLYGNVSKRFEICIICICTPSAATESEIVLHYKGS